MIAIVVKWQVKPEYADEFVELTAEFTAATRAEAGCLWFDWSRSCEDPNEYVLVEAFRDDAAAAHVGSDHFATAMKTFGRYLVERPRIVSVQVPGEDWSRLGEIEMP